MHDPAPWVQLPPNVLFRLRPSLLEASVRFGPVFRSSWRATDVETEVTYLVGHEANRFVLQTKASAFVNGPGYDALVSRDVLGVGLINEDGDVHDADRASVAPAFDPVSSAAAVGSMCELFAGMVDTLQVGERIELCDFTRDAFFRFTALHVLGKRGSVVTELRRCMRGLLELKSTSRSALIRAAAPLRARARELLVPIIEREPAPGTALAGMIEANRVAGVEIEPEVFVWRLVQLLSGGHDTSASLTAWIGYELARHPAHAATLRDELSGIDLASIDASHLRRLPFLNAVVRECERLYPSLPVVPRVAARDVEFAGYRLAAGTHVALALSVPGIDPSVYEHPFAFLPERPVPKIPPLTFGAGPRTCIGVHVASIAIRLLTAYLAKVTFEPCWTDEPRYCATFIARPVPGIPVRVTSLQNYN